MKRQSPLDILRELRQRAHDTRQAQLAEQLQAEKAAEARAERVRNVLCMAREEENSARLTEDRRLGEGGITAAEGQQRMGWERARRRSRAELAEELERAVDSHRQALLRAEQAKHAVQRSDAELKEVQERLDRAERARQHELERVQQENVDESSLRRFLERNGA